MKKILLLAWLVGVFAVIVQNVPPSYALQPTATFPILFASNRDGNYEIYVINSDSSGLQNLTNTPGYELYPHWSPNKDQIVFMAGTEASLEDISIYTMNSDGSNLQELVAFEQQPAFLPSLWSPDSTQIAFFTFNAGKTELYVVDPTDGVLRKLNDFVYKYPQLALSWSPDGSEIATISNCGEGQENSIDSLSVCVTNVANGSVHAIATFTEHPFIGNSIFPMLSWSPDGSQIAFADGEDGQIYLVNTDGSNLRNLTNNAAFNNNPVWSPDGAQIAFVSAQDGVNWKIYAVNTGGSNLGLLSETTGNEAFPMWSPDGSQIVFTSFQSSGADIYVINADGSNLLQLTDDPGCDITFMSCAM